MKTKIRNFGAMALLVAFSFITTVTLANDAKGGKPAVELKYLGNVQDRPLFQLSLNSTDEKDFTIAIKDVYGNILYTEKVKAKTFTRVFQLDTDEIEDDVLHVEVRADKNSKPEIFAINRNGRFVEETTVSKL